MNEVLIRKIYFNMLYEVINSITILHPIKTDKPVRYVRLEENMFILTEEIQKPAQVVTAHRLSQYINNKYSVRLDNSVECWLDWLIFDRLEEITL